MQKEIKRNVRTVVMSKLKRLMSTNRIELSSGRTNVGLAQYSEKLTLALIAPEYRIPW